MRNWTACGVLLAFAVLLLPATILAADGVQPPDLDAWSKQPDSRITVCPLDFTQDGIPDAVFRLHSIRREIQVPGLLIVTRDLAAAWSDAKDAKPLSADWKLEDYPQFLQAEVAFLVHFRLPIVLDPLLMSRYAQRLRGDGELYFFLRRNGTLTHTDTVHLAADADWDGPVTERTSTFGRSLIEWAARRGASPELAERLIPSLKLQKGEEKGIELYPQEAWLGCRTVVKPSF